MYKNKKGVMDIFYLITILLVVSISFVLMFYVGDQINQKAREKYMEQSDRTEVGEVMDKTIERLTILDYFFMGVFAAFVIGIIVTSYLINAHPIFVPLYVFLLAFAFIVALPASNIYQELQAKDTVLLNDTIATHFTITTHIMINLPIYVMVIGFLSMVLIYVRTTPAGGGPVI